MTSKELAQKLTFSVLEKYPTINFEAEEKMIDAFVVGEKQHLMLEIMDKIDAELGALSGKIHTVDVIRIIASMHNKLNDK